MFIKEERIKFNEELKDWIVNHENKEKRYCSNILSVLHMNKIYTFEDLRNAIQNSKKVIWYFDVYGIGPGRAIYLERFVSYKLGKPIPHKDPTIEELKAQVNELNREINRLRKERNTNA